MEVFSIMCYGGSPSRPNGASRQFDSKNSAAHAMVAAMIGRFLAVMLAALALTASPAQAQEGQRALAVVELYTSQSCTQCPRANRLLGRFAREQSVLALTIPVGIWDYLGWRDTFARPEFGQRQSAYAQALRGRGRTTPQLIINGERTIGAVDWDEARLAFDAARAAGLGPGAPEIALARARGNRVRVNIGAGASNAPADIWLAAFDPGPVGVSITGGLNRNRTITYYNLVSSIDRLGAWSGDALTYERSRCTPECALILQEPNGGRILAAAYTDRRLARRGR